MAGAAEKAGWGGATAFPGLGVAKVSELLGHHVSPAEGKLLAGWSGATVRGDGMNHGGQGLRGCHVRAARGCATHARQGQCGAEGFVGSLPSTHKYAP